MPAGSNRSDRGVGGDVVALHLPHRALAVVAVQEKVGFAVIAEVADPVEMPARRDRSDRGVQGDMVAVELPDRKAALVVAEQDIADTVAIEVVRYVMAGGNIVI